MPLAILRGAPWPGTVTPDNPDGVPLFTDADYEIAMQFELEVGSACPDCGHHSEDFYDERGVELDEPPYVPDVVRCPLCAAIEERGEQLQKEIKDGKARKGGRVIVRRWDPAKDGDPEFDDDPDEQMRRMGLVPPS